MYRPLIFIIASTACSIAALQATAQTASTAPWSGIYVGINGGWNGADTHANAYNTTVNQLTGVNDGTGVITVPSTTYTTGYPGGTTDGFMGGGQVGFNVQSGGFVWGAEGDFDGLSNRSYQTNSYALPATGLTTGSTVSSYRSLDPKWISTIRGRLGFAYDRALIYATGGVAFVNVDERAAYSYAPNVTDAVVTANPGVTYGPYNAYGSNSDTHTGWTVGGGVEFLVAHNFTVGAEYRYTDAGNWNSAFGYSGANGVYENGRVGFSDNAVLLKANFKFSGIPTM